MYVPQRQRGTGRTAEGEKGLSQEASIRGWGGSETGGERVEKSGRKKEGPIRSVKNDSNWGGGRLGDTLVWKKENDNHHNRRRKTGGEYAQNLPGPQQNVKSWGVVGK